MLRKVNIQHQRFIAHRYYRAGASCLAVYIGNVYLYRIIEYRVEVFTQCKIGDRRKADAELSVGIGGGGTIRYFHAARAGHTAFIVQPGINEPGLARYAVNNRCSVYYIARIGFGGAGYTNGIVHAKTFFGLIHLYRKLGTFVFFYGKIYGTLFVVLYRNIKISG